MTVGHAEDEIGLLHEGRGEHAAALMGDIDAEFTHGLHGVMAGRLAIDRPQTGRKDAVVATRADRMAKDALRHGAAANVTRANEQDCFHPKISKP
jgi:hypothetical protein